MQLTDEARRIVSAALANGPTAAAPDRRARLVRALDEHPDPAIRALGRRLTEGARPSTLLAEPAFRRLLESTYRRIADEHRHTAS